LPLQNAERVLTPNQKRELTDIHTIVSLGGKIDQKHVLVFSWTFKPRRKFQAGEGWPANEEENMERLRSCGFVSDRGIPKCDNCGQMVSMPFFQSLQQQHRVRRELIPPKGPGRLNIGQMPGSLGVFGLIKKFWPVRFSKLPVSLSVLSLNKILPSFPLSLIPD
jgi:hypothetical protein